MTPEIKPNRAAGESSRYDLAARCTCLRCAVSRLPHRFSTAFARQAVYIDDQQFGWAEIGALLFGLTICLPLGFLLADYVALAISKRLRGGDAIPFLWPVCADSLIDASALCIGAVDRVVGVCRIFDDRFSR